MRCTQFHVCFVVCTSLITYLTMSESVTDTNLTPPKENVLQPSQLENASSTVINQHSKSASKDKHLQKSCPICFKNMRSDHLKRHLRTHNVTKLTVLMISCDICEKVMHKNNLKRHKKIHKSFSKDGLTCFYIMIFCQKIALNKMLHMST